MSEKPSLTARELQGLRRRIISIWCDSIAVNLLMTCIVIKEWSGIPDPLMVSSEMKGNYFVLALMIAKLLLLVLMIRLGRRYFDHTGQSWRPDFNNELVAKLLFGTGMICWILLFIPTAPDILSALGLMFIMSSVETAGKY